MMDNFKLPERYDGLLDDLKESLKAMVEELERLWNVLREEFSPSVEALQDLYDEIQNNLYMPPRKPIRPPKYITHPSNILFDKRVRIHRCRNNC